MYHVPPWRLVILVLLATSTHPCVVSALAVGPQKNRLTAADGDHRLNSPSTQRPNTDRNRANERSRTGYSLRANGVKSSGRVKPPKWEREGDDLYAEFTTVGAAVNLEGAQKMLEMLARNATESAMAGRTARQSAVPREALIYNETSETTSNTRLPPSGTMWGSLSVGPVLRARLVDKAGLQRPTAVQEAAFEVILKGQNAVIASPTGTGKSLSYLIPLLCKFGLQTPSIAIILTPTVELAIQLQRELDDRLGFMEGDSPSAIQVVGGPGSDESDDQMLLSSIGTAPFLAGTPKSLQRLLDEAKRSTNSKVLGHSAKAVLYNPKCIVLDEADRLLKTEQMARHAATTMTKTQSKPRFGRKTLRPTVTSTELLLRDLPLARLQLVCASATVGRTLRKQIMDLVGAPSIEKASVLVTADNRTKKDATLRRASWIPSEISHWYRLLPITEYHGDNKAVGMDDQIILEQASAIQAIWDTMQKLQPATSIVFPGRAGVARVREMLHSFGLRDVRTLHDYVADKSAHSTHEPSATTADWENTCIYVVAEKFSRGLDLPGVDYVFLMAPPSSAAGYAHLAGRTGRNHRAGKAITLVRPREAFKIVAIADALGVSFAPVVM